jgi:hypothetical protein
VAGAVITGVPATSGPAQRPKTQVDPDLHGIMTLVRA